MGLLTKKSKIEVNTRDKYSLTEDQHPKGWCHLLNRYL